MNSASQHLTVLLDQATLKTMRFIDMVSRIDQIRATRRYDDCEIYLDGSLNAVVARKVVA